jgi:hypothetical protein
VISERILLHMLGPVIGTLQRCLFVSSRGIPAPGLRAPFAFRRPAVHRSPEAALVALRRQPAGPSVC